MITMVTAVFSGKDGSLGYAHGKEYVLEVRQARFSHRIWINHPECGLCEYDSIGAFFANWKNITFVNK